MSHVYTIIFPRTIGNTLKNYLLTVVLYSQITIWTALRRVNTKVEGGVQQLRMLVSFA